MANHTSTGLFNISKLSMRVCSFLFWQLTNSYQRKQGTRLVVRAQKRAPLLYLSFDRFLLVFKALGNTEIQTTPWTLRKCQEYGGKTKNSTDVELLPTSKIPELQKVLFKKKVKMCTIVNEIPER